MAALQSQTFNGFPSGMNLAQPAHELADTEARYLQDVLLDYPGLTRRRGPVRPASGFVTFDRKACGMVGTITPDGTYKILVLTGTGANGKAELLSNDFASRTSIDWAHNIGVAPYTLFDAKPALLGGALIGTSSQYNSSSPSQALAFWRGGNRENYNTGTVSFTLGSKTVTGSGTSWLANVASGMFLFADTNDSSRGNHTLTFIGVIKSVDSNTQITLVDNALYTSTGRNYNLQSLRGLQYKILKGRITTSTANTTVTGANTKFLSQNMDEVAASVSFTTSSGSAVVTAGNTANLKVGMRVSGTNISANSFINSIDSGTQFTMNQNASGAGTQTLTFRGNWNIYRASDMSWVGRVASVTNEISITLAANSAIALNNEKFVAIRGDGDWSQSTMGSDHKVGFLNAFYAGRQWYANNGRALTKTARVWFSDTADPEGLDLASFDGDFFDVSSSIGTDTPIKALIPAYNGLVVIKENETYTISGSTPTTFSVKKIQDDGTFSGMSAQPYAGGVVWAGVEGIYFYDGITVQNLSAEKLGDYYKNAVRNLDPQTYRLWAMVVRGHYMLHIQSFQPSVGIQKGLLSYTPSSTTIVINLETRAFSLFTNLNIRGWLETPSDTGEQVLYLVNDNTKANICKGFDLFDTDENDSILCDLGSSAGIHRNGVTSVGISTSFNAVGTGQYFSRITIPTRGAVTSVSAYTEGQGGGSGTCNARAGIYSDSSGVPNAVLGTSSTIVLNQADGPAFREFSFSTPVELAPGDYWIGVHVETSSRIKLFQGSTADAMKIATNTFSSGLENPFVVDASSPGPVVAYATILTGGPDFFVESKKYTHDDSMRKKLFKQLSLTYLVQGDTLRLDTVPGMQQIGRTANAPFPITVYTWDALVALLGNWDALAAAFPTWNALVEANFKPKRIKFIKRNQMISFRLWQNSPAVTRASLGPFQILFKWQRLGRI